MDTIQITILYAPVLALIFAVLSLLVVFQRTRNDVPFGDGGVQALRDAVRAHGNFAEYVPFATVLIGFLELTGLAAIYVHYSSH